MLKTANAATGAAPGRIRVLIVEDSRSDAELEIRELVRAGLAIEHRIADSRESLRRELLAFRPDIILSDFSMPGFDGTQALAIARDIAPLVPFIYVSGTLGEEHAIQAIKEGATDYVLKTNLIRLPPAVERALRQAREAAARREIERVLQENEAGLRRAQAMAQLAHVITGHDGSFENWSDTLPQLLGIPDERMPQTTRAWLALVHPEDRESFRAAAIEGARTRKRIEFEYRLQRADGAWMHIRQVSEPMGAAADAAGRLRWFGTLQDVSAQKLAAQALMESEAIKGAVLGASLDCIVTIDHTGRILEFNPAAEATFGHTRAQAIGRPMADLIIPPRLRAAHQRGFARFLATGEGQVLGRRIELDAIRADGSEFPVELAVVAIRGGANPVFTGFIRDLTERKRSEEEQRSVRQLLDNIVENIPTAVQLKSVADGFRMMMWNKAAERMYGVLREEAIGRNVHDLWPKADADRFHAADLELIADGRMQDFPDRPAQTKDRGEIRVHMRKVALFDDAGKATHLLVIADDITAQLADQARLRESEARFRSLSQLSSDWFWQQDDQFRFVDFTGGDSPQGWGVDQNSALGLRRWELPGVSPLSGSWDEHKARLDARLPFRDFEYQHVRADGTTKYISASGEPLLDADGRFVGYRGVATDISGRKQAERELLRFRTAMDLSGDSIVLIDPAAMRYIYVNKAACVQTGRSREQLLQMGPQDLIPMDQEAIRREYDEVIAAGEQGMTFERRIVRSDGIERWVEMHRCALRAEGGMVIVTISRDITERKRAERVLSIEHGVARSLAQANTATEGLQAVIQLVCESEGWDFGRYWRVDQAADLLRFGYSWSVPAAKGEDVADRSREVVFSRGVGLAGKVWQSGEPLWVANVDQDARVHRKDLSRTAGVRCALVIPVAAEGETIGVLTFSSREIQRPDERLLAAMRVIGSLIGQFLRRKESNDRIRRLSRVHAVLSGINALIVRVRDHAELFREACRIAVEVGNFSVAWIAVLDRASTEILPSAASHGVPDSYMESIRNSLGQARSGGGGILGEAIREKRPAFSNDIVNDTRVKIARQTLALGTRALAVLPFLSAGEVTGVLSLHARETEFFDDDEMALLQDLAANVAFAIENLDQAGRLRIESAERTRAEVKVRRLNRVHAVLSGINSAIVRVQSRDELFTEACRVAVENGQFRMAWIGMIDKAAMRVRPVAWRGVGDAYIAKMPVGLEETGPDGRGLAGRTVSNRIAIVVDDMTTDPRITLKQDALEQGFHSLVMLPLLVEDEAVGLLALYAGEIGFFDEDEMKLLGELAGDIAFALDHIGKKERLDYLAYYDQLTGLANRTLFHERLGQHLGAARAAGGKLAVVVADVERFKMVNDSLGRQTGDALLRQVAERLARGAGHSEVARIGSDQFAIVLPEMKGRSEIGRTVEELWRSCLDEPFRLGETEIRVAMKGGIAIFPSDGTDADALFRTAEAAWKKAKQAGERYLFHAPEMTARIAEKLTLENKLRQALEREEFVLHYQPKVDLDSRRIVGVEALIRWRSPERGLVPPGLFIPMLEETGLILQAGEWALKRATQDHGRWLREGVAAPRIAVNVSAIQLRQRDFVEMVKRAIAGGADPTAIDVEITESLLMEDVSSNMKKLAALRELGMKLSIDDFGTGYSSLGYLAKLPVHTLKIDRSFIITMLNEPDTMTLVSTIISLAHSLRLTVVAEGVEQEEQAKMLRLLRCDEMQGYLFSKPLPFEELTPLLRARG